MKLFSLEEFAAHRREAQTKYEAQLLSEVTAGIADRDFDRAIALAGKLFREVYKADSGDEPLNPAAFNDFVKVIDKALNETTTESDPATTSLAVALAILNSSAIAAADADEEPLELEWVSMEDDHVRKTHAAANGQTQPPGNEFTVGDTKMPYPGYTLAPISEWINCRCALRPVHPDDVALGQLAAGLEPDPLTEQEREDQLDVTLALVADSSGPHTSLVVVALPSADDPINSFGDEQKHVTLAYMGEFVGDKDAVHSLVKNTLAPAAPFKAAVSGHGQLGADAAKVLFVEAPEIAGFRAVLESDESTSVAMQAADAHPHFVPHMTVDYADMPEEATALSEINFDRIAVWQGDEQTEYALGAPLDSSASESEESTPDIAPVAAAAPTDPLPDDANGVPVHGVLAPEGIASGDGRGFKPGSLSHRPLPLPGTWQERTADGHDDAAVVFMIEKIEMIDGQQHFSGHLRTTDDADKFLGLMVDFGGRYGLSVDADSAVGEYDEAEDITWFSEARTSGAGSVNIPAFHEAYVAIGPHPVLDAEDYVPADGEALAAAGAFLEAVQQFKDLAPGKTEDGPGWLTHPIDTDRLRDYWVRGEGAAKIAWGAPGDFNRCRVNLAEYVKPEFLNGYCANRHYDALHVWPGQEAANESLVAAATAEATMAPSINIVKANTGWCAPSEWFLEPEGDESFVITEEGRTFGYLAEWGTCHIGLPGTCTAAPTSDTNYAYFLTGRVPTTDGFANVGQLTIGDGHADLKFGYRGAAAHYDNVCAAWADVAVGENERGIWFAGAVRHNATPEMIFAAQASGRLSGDWRDVHGNLELCAALSINSGGFPVPEFALLNGVQTSLVAAGAIHAPETPASTERDTVASQIDWERLADIVVARLEQRDAVRELVTALEGD